MSNIKFLDDVGIEQNSTLIMASSLGSEYLTIGNNNTTVSTNCVLKLGNNSVDTSLVLERNNGDRYAFFSNGQITFYVDGEVPSMLQFVSSSIPQTIIFGSLTVGVVPGQTTGTSIELREAQTSGANYIKLKAADSITASQDYTLPTNYPSSNGQVLSSTTGGVMSWSTGGTSDTNIANTNLSLNANRTLSLSSFSLDINSGSGNVLDLNSNNVQIYNALYLRTDSATTAPAMRFAEGTGNDFISLRAPDTLSGSTDFVLPAADGTAGQVLQTDGSGNLSFATGGGGGNSSFSLISAGGRVTIGTGSDNNARILVLGGSLGVNYFNWTTVMSNSTPSFTSLGTPGTSTTQGVPYNTNNAAFVSPKSGKISMTGTIEFSSASETAGAQMFLYIFKYPSSLVTAMANGTYVASTAMTLVGSTSVTAPSSAQNIIPMSFTCGGNITANSGEYFFGAFAYRGTVTGNRYFLINYNLFTE